MGKKPKYKMSISERAKQFMPFSALTGFEEAIKKVEDQYYQNKKIILSENEKELLDQKIQWLKIGQEITIKYYNDNSIEFLNGLFKGLDQQKSILKIMNEKIEIDNILDIIVEEDNNA